MDVALNPGSAPSRQCELGQLTGSLSSSFLSYEIRLTDPIVRKWSEGYTGILTRARHSTQ